LERERAIIADERLRIRERQRAASGGCVSNIRAALGCVILLVLLMAAALVVQAVGCVTE
jgi:hypothetical protein